MSNLLEIIKPQLDGMHEMYRIGYEAGVAEGRRQAFTECLETLKKINEVKK